MAEWGGVLLTFWALWLVDQLKFPRWPQFNVVARGRRVHIRHTRLCLPGIWPGNWRALAPDLPFSFSPAGIANRGAGQMARPAGGPHTAQAWRWEEIKEVSSKKGWLWINGARFCPDTGHLTTKRIQKLATIRDDVQRQETLERTLRSWIRPSHLRRRAAVVRAYTAPLAVMNTLLLGLAVFFTAYLTCELTHIPEAWLKTVARALPMLGLYAALLHTGGIILGWRAARRLRVAGEDGRSVALFSALMLPPQALRLRSLVSTGYFPPQHPLCYALAFKSSERARLAFQVCGDLRWPIGLDHDAAPARQITSWFRAELAKLLRPHLRAAGINEDDLFSAPTPDSPLSCRYCPRCRDQFVQPLERCAHGVPLEPLTPGTENAIEPCTPAEPSR